MFHNYNGRIYVFQKARYEAKPCIKSQRWIAHLNLKPTRDAELRSNIDPSGEQRSANTMSAKRRRHGDIDTVRGLGVLPIDDEATSALSVTADDAAHRVRMMRAKMLFGHLRLLDKNGMRQQVAQRRGLNKERGEEIGI